MVLQTTLLLSSSNSPETFQVKSFSQSYGAANMGSRLEGVRMLQMGNQEVVIGKETVERLRLEETFGPHLVQPHQHRQGYLSPGHERPLQPDTEHIQ